VGVGGLFGLGGGVGLGGTGGVGGSVGVGGRLGRGGAGSGGVGSGGVTGTGGSSGLGTQGLSLGGAVSTGGTSSAGGASGAGGRCGDGILGPGEQCDLGSDNEALPAFMVTQSESQFVATPLARASSCEDFYGYSSSSAHTGYEALGTGRIFLYIDKSTLTLSLVFFQGIDQDSSGLEQPSAHVQLLFSGLPGGTTVAVSDDSDELLMTSMTTATGFWKFTNNSDGGALTNLSFPAAWEITVAPSFIDGVTAWTWLQSDGSLVNLDPTQPITIKAHSFASKCRPDCTIPRCGDGILDGGEICDGNDCDNSCLSFR
jgi:hypothetical protein